MIIEGILNILAFLPNLLLDSIEGISVSIPPDAFNGLNSIFNCLGFLFPISGLLIILLLSFTLKGFQTIWALILRIKSFIPTMGA